MVGLLAISTATRARSSTTTRAAQMAGRWSACHAVVAGAAVK